MRTAATAVLVVTGFVLGVLGVLMLGVSGLSWAGPDPGFMVIPYGDSDEAERAIGIGMGLAGLTGWLIATVVAAVVGLGGGATRSRRGRIAAASAVAVSTIAVVGLTAVVLSTPPPPSEYPLPEWGRALPQGAPAAPPGGGAGQMSRMPSTAASGAGSDLVSRSSLRCTEA